MKDRWFTLLPLLIILSMMVSACAVVKKYSHVNINKASAECTGAAQKSTVPSASFLATTQNIPFDMDWECRNKWKPGKGFQSPKEECSSTSKTKDPNFIGIALSGGGSRAAVFSAAVLFELEAYGLLQQADVISSASGGSFTAALYALSCDDVQDDCPATLSGAPRVEWKPDNVFPLLQRNFIARWVGNWFYPPNIPRFWFTYFDRGDAMAQTLSNSLYGNTQLVDKSLRFRDLNPRRPHLVINATNNTDSNDGIAPFSFTREDFEKIDSCLDLYPVSYAVTASSAFPAVFHYVTLQDYRTSSSERGNRFIHLMDAGVVDNLAVAPLNNMLDPLCPSNKEGEPQPHILVIVTDAEIPSKQKSAADPDPRTFLDRFIGTNFIDIHDVMMNTLKDFRIKGIETLPGKCDGKLMHLQFSDLNANDLYTKISDPNPNDIYEVVRVIKTNLRINSNDANCLRHAARILVRSAVKKLRDDPYWGPIVRQGPVREAPLPVCEPLPKDTDR